MPTIGFDGQSFSIDGRRVWLVSGSVHYARIPRELWRHRIRAAKQAGLNCIETYVFWNVHEPRPGRFVFDGDADLRAFVKIIVEEGLYCILRPGPYVCAEWDFGGLPAWVLNLPEVKLRQANRPFLEAAARYFGAVMKQVKDLQVTELPSHPAGNGASGGASGGGASGGGGGGVILMQAENEWFCHNPEQADGYLAELVRYLREEGCTVPIISCNNLWQRLDGTIDTWNANTQLARDLRGLAVVQPNAPRLVSEFWPGWFDAWNSPHHQTPADTVLHRLAVILAHGAQFNLFMFHGGTNFGFTAGRTVASPDCFITTSYDYDAPLHEAGGRGEKYLAVKRIGAFASTFGHVFAALDPRSVHTVAAPDEPHEPSAALSVIHQSGTQGDVVFIFKGNDKRDAATVMLPDGRTLTMPLDDEPVAWFVLRANLGGIAELSHTTLRPWAFLHRRMLVVYGPAGAAGEVLINDAPLDVTVPAAGGKPVVATLEGVTVAVLNRQQIDAAYVTADGLVIGAAGLDDDHRPIPLPGWPAMTFIHADGSVRNASAKITRTPAAPTLGNWQQHRPDSFLDGSDASFKTIDGPASHEALGNDFGYGWYRFQLKPIRHGKLLAPQSAHRTHLFHHSKAHALPGVGPGATDEPIHFSPHGDVTALTDNLGRFNFGWHVGESTGLFGHLYAVKPVPLGKPKITAGRAPDLFELGGFWTNARKGERPPADTLAFPLRAGYGPGKPLILDIRGLPMRLMVRINDRPVAAYDPALSAGFLRVVLEAGRQLHRGKAVLQLALFDRFDPKIKLDRHVTLHQATDCLSDKGPWAFAPWRVPSADDFARLGPAKPLPCWYRATFKVTRTDVPLWLEPRGMTKGQIFINGHNAGRYFVTTPAPGSKPIPPQSRYYLPEPWLKTGQANELILFDEHGHSPRGCRLAYGNG